jgi:hypothetical protein
MDPDGQPKISDGPRLRLWQWASLRWQVKLEGGEGVASGLVRCCKRNFCDFGGGRRAREPKGRSPPKAANEVAIPPLGELVGLVA